MISTSITFIGNMQLDKNSDISVFEFSHDWVIDP